MEKFASIRMIFALVARMDREVIQVDVKTTFLHGELGTVIFIDQLEGFVSKGHKCKVC